VPRPISPTFHFFSAGPSPGISARRSVPAGKSNSNTRPAGAGLPRLRPCDAQPSPLLARTFNSQVFGGNSSYIEEDSRVAHAAVFLA
jgi:hypothetical protein